MRLLRLAQNDAHVVAPEAIFLAAHERSDHLCVLNFLTHLRAVFATERDVEHRAELRLQRQRLADQLFTAGVVIAGRQHSGLRFAIKQYFGGGESTHRRRRVRFGEKEFDLG